MYGYYIWIYDSLVKIMDLYVMKRFHQIFSCSLDLMLDLDDLKLQLNNNLLIYNSQIFSSNWLWLWATFFGSIKEFVEMLAVVTFYS